MKIGDPEPGNMPKATTLRVAKVEYKKSTYLDPDPIKAIQIMKHTTWKTAIHTIFQDPFGCHLCTTHQSRLYFDYTRTEVAEISIDASGGMIKCFEVFAGESTGPIFLYLIVVNDESGQYVVAAMISSTHNTVAILNFLNEWVRLGAPHPKIVNCDGSTALITAIIRAFTQDHMILEYTEDCESGTLPNCYVRLDVAHFIKLWVDFLSTLTSLTKIKTFYKAAIGQLILSRDLEMARKVVKAILLVSQSEFDGPLIGSSQKTHCQEYRDILKTMIDPRELEDQNEDPSSEESAPNRPEDESILDAEVNKNYSNFWTTWFTAVSDEVQEILKSEVGEHDNAYYLPQLAKRLERDIKWLPLWSCILTNLGMARFPAPVLPVRVR